MLLLILLFLFRSNTIFGLSDSSLLHRNVIYCLYRREKDSLQQVLASKAFLTNNVTKAEEQASVIFERKTHSLQKYSKTDFS